MKSIIFITLLAICFNAGGQIPNKDLIHNSQTYVTSIRYPIYTGTGYVFNRYKDTVQANIKIKKKFKGIEIFADTSFYIWINRWVKIKTK